MFVSSKVPACIWCIPNSLFNSLIFPSLNLTMYCLLLNSFASALAKPKLYSWLSWVLGFVYCMYMCIFHSKWSWFSPQNLWKKMTKNTQNCFRSNKNDETRTVLVAQSPHWIQFCWITKSEAFLVSGIYNNIMFSALTTIAFLLPKELSITAYQYSH